MKLGSSAVSAAFVLALCHCGPLVNDPLLDAGSSGASTTSGASASGSSTGAASGSGDASMSGSASGSTSGDVSGTAAGASGASSGATSGGAPDGAATDMDAASSGSSSGTTGTSGASGSGGPDATSQGDNLVSNGDFSQGGTYWGISMGTGAIDAGSDQLCVSVGSGSGTIYLGWPQTPLTNGMSLASGTMYTFSYKAQAGQGNVTVEAKIADSMSPYTPVDSDSTMDMVTSSLQTFTHSFTPTMADPSAGVVFIFSSSSTDTVCFQSVSVVAQ